MKKLLNDRLEKLIREQFSNFLYRYNKLNDYLYKIKVDMTLREVLKTLIKYKDMPINYDINTIMEVIKESERITNDDFESEVTQQIIISLCSAFETLIIEILRLLFLDNPSKIISESKADRQNQTITYEKLMCYKKLEDIIIDLVDEKIWKMSRKLSVPKLVKRIKFFKSDFSISEEYSNMLIEIFQIRNLIVHNQSEINAIFINNVKSQRYKKLQVGDKLKFTLNDAERFSKNIFKIALDIQNQVGR